MFVLRVAMTIIDTFLIYMFLVTFDIKSKEQNIGAIFIELAMVCNIFLIWS